MSTPRARKSAPKITTAIAYLRVSVDEDLQAMGLEAQRAAILDWATREAVEVTAWHEETVSGGAALSDRPVLLGALAEAVAAKSSYLVVHRLDRFARDSAVAVLAEQELTKGGVSLAVAVGPGTGDDPASKLMRTLLVAVGEFERAMIRARVKGALKAKKSKGELTGSAPYGMRAVEGPMRLRRDGTATPVQLLEPDPSEQAVIAQALELSSQGLSVRAIEAELAGRGVLGRRGRPLTRDAVWSILATHR